MWGLIRSWDQCDVIVYLINKIPKLGQKIKLEFEALMNNKTWGLIPRSFSQNIVNSKGSIISKPNQIEVSTGIKLD